MLMRSLAYGMLGLALANAVAVQAAIPAPERQALLDLYTSTNGAGWTDNSGWGGAAGTECTWYGVICDAGETTVVAIVLENNELFGTLPASLEGLSNLQVLDLAFNFLSGPIPPGLGNLTSLMVLDLATNDNLAGPIPPDLGNLSNLQELTLAYNALSGGIPPGIGNLTNLQKLDLHHNHLNGQIPQELGSLTSLQLLYLSENQLTGAVPSELGDLVALQQLSLDRNQLSNAIPVELGNLTSLQYLYLEVNQLSGSIPAELGNLVNLVRIQAGSNQLTGPIPDQLGNLVNLNNLDLASNQLTGSIPASLGNLANLSYLRLTSNQLTGPIPIYLGDLTHLQFVYLGDNHLTGQIPAQLGNLTGLDYLSLDRNQLTGHVPASLGNLTGLLVLLLSSNQLSGPVPSTFANLTNLLPTVNDFRWNALYSNDPALIAFLDSKQIGSDWQSTQTVAPDGVAAAPGPVNTQALVSWAPILYTYNGGGYRVSYAVTSGGPYTFFGITPDKTSTSLIVTGLEPATTYHFIVESQTDPHTNNQSTVVSDPSAEVAATTLAPLVITPDRLPQAFVGSPYSVTFAASGGEAPYAWSISAGSPPDALTLSSTGVLQGTPTALGSFGFTVRAEDSVGNIGEAPYTLTVAAQVPTLGGVGLALFILALAAAGVVRCAIPN